jgi:hypothetical protein
VLFEEMMVAASLTLKDTNGPLPAPLSASPDSSKAPVVEVEVEAEEEGPVREVAMALVGQLRGDLLKMLDYALRSVDSQH